MGFSEIGMSGTMLDAYQRRVASGELQADAAQQAAVAQFGELAGRLSRWRSERRGWRKLFGAKAVAPKGLYVHGSVGRGKTMLMDLFFEVARIKRKRRVHFHEFMAEVHDRIGEARKRVDGDPIPFVARAISDEVRLLCFDELHVTDIADAMILGRLFKVLFEEQVVVVATSNARPDELYRNGLNRQLFLPFIDLITAHMAVMELDASKDFRLEKLTGRQLYFTPDDDEAAARLDEIWTDLTGHARPESAQIEVKGRTLIVPQAAMGVARFTFAELCEQPLGSLDYLALARAFHTIILAGIPELTPARRNEARRFINLIDTLYDNRICLIASAAAEPGEIYPAGDGADLFERTESRLIEMRSEEYLAARADRLNVATDDDDADRVGAGADDRAVSG